MAKTVTSRKTKKLSPANTIPTHLNPSSILKNITSPMEMLRVVWMMSTISSRKKGV